MTPTLEQQAAIESVSPNIFAIAGPGAGKTRTLVWRVEHLCSRGVPPETIACLTFTNAGAREMQSRLAKSNIRIGFVGTLHSFMLNLIRQHGKLIGYGGNTGTCKVTVLDDDQSANFLQTIVTRFKWKGTAKELTAAILKGPPFCDTNAMAMSVAELIAAGYWQALRKARLLTFDAILILGERLLIAMRAADVPFAFTRFLIDEVQDSNPIDFRIYKLLDGNQFLVGDPDQSMYGFRGADVSLCLALSRDSNWEVLPLQANYRSGRSICAAAQRLIEHNHSRFQKITLSAQDFDGTVEVKSFGLPAQEASFLAQRIAGLSETVPFTEIAVLVRTNDLVEEYSNHLRAMSIPLATSRPPQRPQGWAKARAIVAFLAQPENDYAAFVCCAFILGESAAVPCFMSFNQAWQGEPGMWDGIPPGTFPGVITNLLRWSVEQEAVNAVHEAMQRLPDDASLDDLLVEMARQDENIVGEGVTVSTIHASKGREFDHVFLPAFEQHIIPSNRKSLNLEEERRIAYVAVTRARQTVQISFCRERVLKWGSFAPVTVVPSQFVAEMQP